ncbi:murein hydrolase activator EnvC family protein [Spirilliplanes yamanashiensis]|uniref:M23ase beta-sheet core domain-containing protein n=1 Tax=Spirilliplanes yamanashiensis TaxID=42233 RepID=A0A8J4DHE5_9ACTN|nr:murein DD-endopeptidase MepM/ murein hydrolase activator NlpD [Spirilliplanes yamanashiensis]GIJ01484.1 hypothetical protein Sya03_08360 [Spirilliplanes yamanashiensis]
MVLWLAALIAALLPVAPPHPGAGTTSVPVAASARRLGGAVPAQEPLGPAGGFRWPLDGTPPVLRRFDPPPQPWLPGHRGVDLGAAPGVPVRASGAGTVVFAGRVAGRGVVSVGHAGGLRTTYEPVEAVGTLSAGDPVVAGEQIGALAAGHPGCPAAACLHWGLRRGEQYLDPLLLLGLGRVRLLPLHR